MNQWNVFICRLIRNQIMNLAAIVACEAGYRNHAAVNASGYDFYEYEDEEIRIVCKTRFNLIAFGTIRHTEVFIHLGDELLSVAQQTASPVMIGQYLIDFDRFKPGDWCNHLRRISKPIIDERKETERRKWTAI